MLTAVLSSDVSNKECCEHSASFGTQFQIRSPVQHCSFIKLRNLSTTHATPVHTFVRRATTMCSWLHL